MVSLLTLSFLLIGMVYPNSWTRFSSESQGKLTEGSTLEPVGYEIPEYVFARISRSGDITAPRNIERPSSCGLETLIDNTVRSPSVTSRDRLLIVYSDAGIFTCSGPHAARCTVSAGITFASHLEAAGRMAPVQIWSVAHTTPDAST